MPRQARQKSESGIYQETQNRPLSFENQRGSVKSFELHSPHKNSPHQKWHWQQNTWNPQTGGVTGRSTRWTLFGRRF